VTGEKERVRGWFAGHAAHYARDASQRAGPDLRRLVELLAPGPGDRVLDAGTAAGNTAAALAPLVAEVVGLDLTPAMAPVFAANTAGAGRVRFEVGDVEALPFPDGSFDLAVTRRAFHHVPDPARAAREMARVLRPGGRAGFVDMTAPESPAAAALFDGIERARDGSHLRALPPSAWRGIVAAAGLEAVAEDLLPDRIPWAAWLSPVAEGGPEDLRARALLEAAAPEARAAVVAEEEGQLLFLKTRIVLIARKK
jgi:SAM-dependent methyltransferase